MRMTLMRKLMQRIMKMIRTSAAHGALKLMRLKRILIHGILKKVKRTSGVHVELRQKREMMHGILKMMRTTSVVHGELRGKRVLMHGILKMMRTTSVVHGELRAKRVLMKGMLRMMMAVVIKVRIRCHRPRNMTIITQKNKDCAYVFFTLCLKNAINLLPMFLFASQWNHYGPGCMTVFLHPV
ncbi:uncharacterized protein LOC124165915 [Ischnura elegans]|uniref:uncharacterized protein LOC124165915 n=1 Tax=Ischnura elegans TaxID=197161 RepID=UPI001ED872BE|nr:uncharacterized protein LOC124165915 [Ischnura elegans]